MTFESPNTKNMVMGKDATVCPNCGATEIEIDNERYESFCIESVVM